MSLIVALEILRAVNSAADAFPPLKGATGGALFIAESVKKFKTSKEDWENFAQHIEIYVAIIMNHISKDDSKKDAWTTNIDTLNTELLKIQKKIEDLQSQKGLKRLWMYLSADRNIQELQSDFDRAMQVFEFQSTLTSRRELLERLRGASAEGIVERLLTTFKKEIVSEIDWSTAFARLPDPIGTSWNPARACLPGTRTVHQDEISAWISADTNSSGKNAEIFLVADALGSGKTTLAHTVCERAHETGHLVASFFFNRLDTDRTTPQNLFGAIIRGLCDINREAKTFIGQKLDGNNTLATASPALQFKELILPVCHHLPKDRPLIIVIDALDEGYDDELLVILRDSIPLLPPTFRFVITSRPEARIMSFMDHLHIRRSISSLSGISNQYDIERYIDSKLRQSLWGSKISAQLKNDFIERTQGLFLWAATVFNHLDKSFKPNSELQSLIDNTSGSWRQGKDAEKKLDNLYHQILSNFEWTDTEFQRAYRTVIGALVTLKEPLSLTALSSLYAKKGIFSDDIANICSRMQTFLTGYDRNSCNQPICLLHLSIQEYLTIRAPSPYHLDKDEHHGVLASCCLETIEEELTKAKIPQLGFTDGNFDSRHIPWIPRVARGNVSEQLWYSCGFFVDHILVLEAENVSPSLAQIVKKILTTKARWLLEMTTSMGRVIDLGATRNWAMNIPGLWEGITIDGIIDVDKQLALCCHEISRCLQQARRYEEALMVTKNTIEIYRRLTKNNSTAFGPDLARALNMLFNELGSLGRPLDAILAIEEAIQIIRPYAADHFLKFGYHLAILLSNISEGMIHLNRNTNALTAIEESIQTYGRLAADQPGAFEHEFATSFRILSQCLTTVDRHAEALTAIEQSVQKLRPLAINQPGFFNGVLAVSLYKLSRCLSKMEHHKDALEAAEESIEISISLVENQSLTWRVDLADSLCSFSNCLSNLGRHTEALEAVEKAAKIYRQVAVEKSLGYDDNANFVATLHVLSKCLVDLGRHEDALKVTQEAIDLSL